MFAGSLVASMYGIPVSEGVEGEVADPTQLELAEDGSPGPTPAAGDYGRSLSSGQTYLDPLTGVTVLKVTDSSNPTGNTGDGAGHGYASGGPRISQAWVADSVTYYTLFVEDGPSGNSWLVDLRYDTMALSNWRAFGTIGETGFAWSMHPDTPRIAYIPDPAVSKRYHRYDTEAMANADTGNWPWNIAAAGTGPIWVQTQLNDTYFALQLNSVPAIVVFNPATGAEIVLTEAEIQAVVATAALDEFHIDKEEPYIMTVTGAAEADKVVWKLDTDAASIATDSTHIILTSHSDTMRGVFCGSVRSGLSSGFHTYDFSTDTPDHVVTVNGWHSSSNEFYHCGNWVMNQRAGEQWMVGDRFTNDDANSKLRAGMIGWIEINTGEVRILCSHDCVGSAYARYPQVACSMDGKLVVWTSDMNLDAGTSTTRKDIFVAKMPVS